MKVGIVNVTGYAGSELARLLYQHPHVTLTSITGRSGAGQRLDEFFPHLSGIDLMIEPELEDGLDLAFSALPHKASADAVIPLIERGMKVVDISADFRLKKVDEYEEWYGVAHPGPQYLEEAVYGLPELHRDQVAQARLIANPGCYPTSAILALAPVVKEGLIEPGVVIDSKSGVSGAGRGLSLTTHFSEVNENVMAYSVGGHRHLPEISQELAEVAQTPPQVTFLTHLIPMTRGILSSCYATLSPGAFSSWQQAHEQLRQLYADFYADEPFVEVPSAPPHTKHTLGNNMCLVYPSVDARTGTLMVISCLDNLVKGAAGQAIQNMNVMYGFPETTALEGLALYP